jgi:hypothetical protein
MPPDFYASDAWGMLVKICCTSTPHSLQPHYFPFELTLDINKKLELFAVLIQGKNELLLAQNQYT